MDREPQPSPWWTRPLGLLTDRYRTDHVVDALAGVQSLRGAVEEIQSAVLHFAALPTRQDVRQVRRRVVGLRRRVAELDLAIARLERAQRRPDDDETATP